MCELFWSLRQIWEKTQSSGCSPHPLSRNPSVVTRMGVHLPLGSSWIFNPFWEGLLDSPFSNNQPLCFYVPNYSAAVLGPALPLAMPVTHNLLWRTEGAHISPEYPGRVKLNTGFIDRKKETLTSLPVCWMGCGLSQGWDTGRKLRVTEMDCINGFFQLRIKHRIPLLTSAQGVSTALWEWSSAFLLQVLK